MGCWNETCMVSNLPICAGDRVVIIPIIENKSGDIGVYSTDYWAPFLPFVRGEYDDYGSIENANDCVFEQIAKMFLPKDNALYDMTGSDFISEFVSQVSERIFELPQNVKIAFVHEALFDEMIQKSPSSIKGWNFVCDEKRPFSLEWRYTEGVYCHRQGYYPTSRQVISSLIEMGEEKRIEEMVKFTFAIDDLRIGYHPTIGSGSQDGVSKFMLDMHRSFVAKARDMRKQK